MKSTVFTFLFALFLLNCSEDKSNPIEIDNQSNVLLLKVDFNTHNFEGGKELTFTDDSGSEFKINANYQPPGDFGSIQLYYNETDDILFDGTIIWMGLGEIQFPENLILPNEFETVSEPMEMPNANLFSNVIYDEFAYYPEDMDVSLIWDAIANLSIVNTFRAQNPNSKIHIFLYTPSVGIGNPEDWDWMVFLKK